jgi:hypothetical protein
MRLDWRCGCGSLDYWVRDTARDEDGLVVRRRVCTACGAQRSTEERIISDGPGAFYARAASRREMQRRLHNQHKGMVPCRYCGLMYQSGRFGWHVRHSSGHAAAIKVPANGSARAKVREYQREYQRRRAAAPFRQPHFRRAE